MFTIKYTQKDGFGTHIKECPGDLVVHYSGDAGFRPFEGEDVRANVSYCLTDRLHRIEVLHGDECVVMNAQGNVVMEI